MYTVKCFNGDFQSILFQIENQFMRLLKIDGAAILFFNNFNSPFVYKERRFFFFYHNIIFISAFLLLWCWFCVIALSLKTTAFILASQAMHLAGIYLTIDKYSIDFDRPYTLLQCRYSL